MQNLHNIFFVCLLSLAQVLHAAHDNNSSLAVVQPATSTGPLITTYIDTVGSSSVLAHGSTSSVSDAIQFIKSIEEPGSTLYDNTSVAIPFKTIYGSGESRMDISYLFQPLGRPEPCEYGFMWRFSNISFMHSLTAGSLPFLFALRVGNYFEWSKEKIFCTAAFLGLCTAGYGFYAKRQPVTISQEKFLRKTAAVKRGLDCMLGEAISLDPQRSTLRWDSTSEPANAAANYPHYKGVQTERGSVIYLNTPEYQQHERNRLSQMHADTLDLEKLQEAHQHNQVVASNLEALINSVTTDRRNEDRRFSRLVMPEIEEHATAQAAEGQEAYGRSTWADLVGASSYPKTNSMFVREFYKYWQRWQRYEQCKMEAKRNNVANGLICGGISVTLGALASLLPKATA